MNYGAADSPSLCTPLTHIPKGSFYSLLIRLRLEAISPGSREAKRSSHEGPAHCYRSTIPAPLSLS